jgi:hypothetical protein
MFSGPPLPLPHDFPLRQLVTLVQYRNDVGVWLRGSARGLRLSIRACGTSSKVLINGDLGLLLRSCAEVVVRQGSQPVVLGAQVLIGWRALQVVTARPYLPCLEWLRDIFPGANLETIGFRVPIDGRAPEDILADCLTHGIPVAGSRIVYRAPGLRPTNARYPAGGPPPQAPDH